MKSCYKKICCELCNKFISVPNYNKHLQSHKTGTANKQHVTHDGLNCIYCGKECKNKNSLIQHEIRCKENPRHITNKGNCKSHTS